MIGNLQKLLQRVESINEEDLLSPLAKKFMLETIHSVLDRGISTSFIEKLNISYLINVAISSNQKLTHNLKLYPKIKDINIKPPVYIVSPPRTGTTALHNLMSACSNYDSLLGHEVLAPITGKGWLARTHSKIKASLSIKLLDHSIPKLKKYHYVTTNAPEECSLLLLSSGMYLRHYMGHFNFVGTPATYTEQELIEIYKVHKLMVQHALYMRQQELRDSVRFTFKCPSAMMYHSLSAIQEIYPDSQFILLHRDPVDTLYSHANLRLISEAASNFKKIDLKNLLAHLLNRHDNMLRYWDQQLDAYSENNKHKLLNISQKSLVKAPQQTLQELCQLTNVEFSEKDMSNINRLLKEQPKKFSRNQYDDLKEILPEKNVRDHYSWYYEKYKNYL